MAPLGLNVEPLFVVYLVAFGGAAVACFASVPRTRRIDHPDTRRGLAALLVLSGGWALAHLAYLLAPTERLAVLFYTVGLVIGLATVGPWLYFCSAYSGRSFHRDPHYRRIAVAVFLAVVAVKVTNPLHHLYFTTEAVSVPFTYFAVENGTIHWVVMGIAYSVTAIGYFMVFERFSNLTYDTRPLTAILGLAALPVVFDVAGYATPWLADINHEPLGVAAFSVGILFVYLDRFQTIQLAGEHDDPLIVLDDQDRIREYNDRALELFSELDDAVGQPLWSTVPAVAKARDSATGIVELDRDGGRYFRVYESPFAAGQRRLGRFLTLHDVTESERHRRELERQNQRLEQFASMVAHDLRNPLNVAMGRASMLQEEIDSDHLEVIERSFDRMATLIDDLLALARLGQPIEETESVSLATVARSSADQVAMDGVSLVVDGDLVFLADPDRLRRLLENLFRNTVEHADTASTIRVGPLDDGRGFYVADDGPGIPPDDREEIFESGFSTAEEGTGFGLAIVREIVEAHDWSVRVVESADGGARFEISGVETA